jgi:hypothetical protein
VGPSWTGGKVQVLVDGPPWWVDLTDPAGGLVYQVELDFGPEDSYVPDTWATAEGYTECYNESGEAFPPADHRPNWPYTKTWAGDTPHPGQQMDIKGKLTFTVVGTDPVVYSAEMDVYQVKYFDYTGDYVINWGSSEYYWWRNPGKPPWAKNDKNMNQCWQAAP